MCDQPLLQDDSVSSAQEVGNGLTILKNGYANHQTREVKLWSSYTDSPSLPVARVPPGPNASYETGRATSGVGNRAMAQTVKGEPAANQAEANDAHFVIGLPVNKRASLNAKYL